MKKKFAIAAIFLITYLVFLIVTLPSTVVLKQITLPKQIAISGVNGTIWQTDIEKLTIGNTSIEQVNAQLSFWSLFSLTPKLDVSFGDPLLSGPEGQLALAISREDMAITDLSILVRANEVAQQLTLPLPISAQGDVELTVSEVSINLQNNQCSAAKGEVNWSKAGVVALEQNIKLGRFSADIRCEGGALALIVSPKNDLGLTFSAYVRQGGRISGNGYLQPGDKFPKALNDALPFLGNKDSQGRYRLSF
ncbi:MAG: type II secretion system protein N [Colwellia sp.]|nr:type II secretion system protein N [Colwellia sp.]MCW8864718.1 type II secretion system protein N [Colwellia sp.]MCW9081911.1 type II secretion system protein N [Colwellia sp.]